MYSIAINNNCLIIVKIRQDPDPDLGYFVSVRSRSVFFTKVGSGFFLRRSDPGRIHPDPQPCPLYSIKRSRANACNTAICIGEYCILNTVLDTFYMSFNTSMDGKKDSMVVSMLLYAQEVLIHFI